MSRAASYMVFDVESVGLHGEGFAVGWTVLDRDRHEVDFGLAACPSSAARGTDADRKWISENVPDNITNFAIPWQVRNEFWLAYQKWTKQGGELYLAADVPWPVEAAFLEAMIQDDLPARGNIGPYPLIDIASIRYAAGLDPLATEQRFDSEKPAHNPLADARQSARLLLYALYAIGRQGEH